MSLDNGDGTRTHIPGEAEVIQLWDREDWGDGLDELGEDDEVSKINDVSTKLSEDEDKAVLIAAGAIFAVIAGCFLALVGVAIWAIIELVSHFA